MYVLVVGPGDRPPARAPHDVEPPGSAPEHGGRALAPAVPGRGQGAPLAPHPAQVPHLELSNCDIDVKAPNTTFTFNLSAPC